MTTDHSTTDNTTGPWVDVPTGHRIRLHEGEIQCRNAKGKILAAVPPAVRRTDEHERLAVLADSLERHRREHGRAVESWMLSGTEVPVRLVAALWEDPDARGALGGVLVQEHASARSGLLMDVEDGRLLLAGPDGGRLTVDAGTVAVAHPARVEGLDRWREALDGWGRTQRADQLSRLVFRAGGTEWLRRASDEPEAPYVLAYTGGPVVHRDYGRLLAAVLPLGVETSPGRLAVRVHEGGRTVLARLEVAGDSPEHPYDIDRLAWFDVDGRRLTFEEVGPVAWSEGARMAWLVRQTGEEAADLPDV